MLSKTTNRKYIESVNRQREFVMGAEKIAGVSPLVRRVIDYEGFTIAGDCMWYLPKTEDDWDFYFDNSNDSSLILSLQHRGGGLASCLHEESMDWYKTLEGKKIDLMVSHVPPIHPTISNDKKNGVYHNPVPFYAAKKWICGHHHLRATFKADGIQFYMNAIGYPREFNQKEIATLILE